MPHVILVFWWKEKAQSALVLEICQLSALPTEGLTFVIFHQLDESFHFFCIYSTYMMLCELYFSF